jgi:hypothetical protein
MSHADQNILPACPQVMSTQDLAQITKGAVMLPGAWMVDPVPDITQAGTPRIWVHPFPPNAIGMSFGFSKQNKIFWVVVRHHADDDLVTFEGTAYGDLGTAFSRLWELLMAMRDSPLKSAYRPNISDGKYQL